MNSEHFRVRGYDVFLVQGWGNELKGTLQSCVTCDVTSSLIPPSALSPLFPVQTLSLPFDYSSQPILLERHSSPPLFPPFLSSCYLLPLHLSSLNPNPSLGSLCFSPPVMAVRLWSAASAAQQGYISQKKEVPCSSPTYGALTLEE